MVIANPKRFFLTNICNFIVKRISQDRFIVGDVNTGQLLYEYSQEYNTVWSFICRDDDKIKETFKILFNTDNIDIIFYISTEETFETYNLKYGYN